MSNAGAPRGWFTAWCAVGATLVLGVISLGPLLELPALIGAVILVSTRNARRAADGLLLGGGIVCLLVASLYLRGSEAGDLDPYPWLLAGLLLVAVPLVYRLTASRSPRTYSRRDVS